MALNIGRNGIAFRQDDGTTAILLPGRNGGPGTQIEVPAEIAETYRLAPGDIAEGELQPIAPDSAVFRPDAGWEAQADWDTQRDEPQGRSRAPSSRVPVERPSTHRLVSITHVNGLSALSTEPTDIADSEAGSRPFPKTQRSRSERTSPDRRLALATGRGDVTGRTLDFAAPLGAGVLGILYGPHGAGLTRTLQSVLNGIVTHAPDCVPLILLLRPRAEEATEWRRRFPQADVVVGASALSESAPEQTLQLCDLVLEAAQRQTELGRDVVLLVDSLTALWGTMLEAEEADAQREADISQARRRMQEWVRKAGCFHGAAPLGGGLGGSLTLIGTVWHQTVDTEAEEEHDLHPHLRLLEHILPEAGWLVPLSDTLALRRLYPTIDIRRCRSRDEERLLPADSLETHLKVRGRLPDRDPLACYLRVQDALASSTDQAELLAALE
jgi:transcription termination factor Rho